LVNKENIMEIKIDLEALRKRKLFVATPMYGGQCGGMYTRSICDLTALCVKYGIEVRSYFLFNESLITRARNYCVDEFLRSDAEHMLKCITWEKIKQAVDAGVADEDPNRLEDFVGDFVFNPAVDENDPSTKSIRLDEPAQVLETGTGFMMIRRSTFDKYKMAYPQYSYKPDHIRTEAFDGSREIHAYFDCIIDPKTKRYLSEDYMFCQNVRNMGGKVWMCPWMHLQHTGAYVFAGKLPALASIGASATADAGLVGRNTKKIKPINTQAPNQDLLKNFRKI